MGRKKEKKRIDTAGQGEPLKSSPFAQLAALSDSVPSTTDTASVAPGAPPQPAPALPKRAVVRFQRKGRGGKEVTLVEHLGLPQETLEAWLKRLKQRLGCGGQREGEVLVLQGDQRERLPELLRQEGVSRVSVS